MRLLPLAVVILFLACGGHRPGSPVVPAPAGELDALVLPPAPALDTIVPTEELAAELRIAADSAADEEVLEALADASPTDGDSDDVALESEGSGAGGAKALTSTAVSWDIDVDTYNSHDRVQYYLDFFQGRGRERMGIWLTRMPRYEAMIREQLQEQGLPGDLVYLALIESGFSNSATSRARAVGMWQFMKGTAKGYGLRVDSWVDERRDPYKATTAAARHLKDLNNRFGSLYLAAAAYNAGAGKVSRGLGRLPDEEEADSVNADAMFFRLYDTKFLRRETKDYVPKLIAAALIAKEPARYGFEVGAGEPAVYDSIVVPTMTGLDVVARLADTTVAAIRELNPQYLRLATPPGVSSVVRVPAGRGPTTVAAYEELPASRRVTFVEHTVARGETFSGIAKRYHVSSSLLAQANPRLHARRLRPGQRVIVPTGGAISSSVARHMADPVEPAASSPSGFHRVRRGETLSGLAAEYGVTVRQLRAWNRLGSDDGLRAGQRIRVAAASSRVHRVRQGETLTGLAKRYGVSVRALRAANGMTSDDGLRAGARLKIPG
jgi:membrane-bound lytic murein transglycosylase D